MKHRQEISYQLDLFMEQKRNDIHSLDNRKDVNQAKVIKVVQVKEEGRQGRALTSNLMAIVCSSDNLKQAYKQVKRNKGVAGVDQMPTTKFAQWFIEQGELLVNDLLQGKYRPQVVQRVEIPKPKGGFRKLGIPTVTDRIIQQAIAQILSPIYEREFSEHSYGFRPRRNAHMALQQASEYVADG